LRSRKTALLSGELGKLETKSEFAGSLRVMRAACRKFLDCVGIDGRETVLYANHHGHWASWTFCALGEMRGTFGVRLAKIAAEFKLDIQDRLVAILPRWGWTFVLSGPGGPLGSPLFLLSRC
jgi:hypothetical protein